MNKVEFNGSNYQLIDQERVQLSTKNQENLQGMAQKIEKALNDFMEASTPPPTTGVTRSVLNYIQSSIYSILPSGDSVGRMAGRRAALTYGPDLVNNGIDSVTNYIFGRPKPETTKEWVVSQVCGFVGFVSKESSKMWITPELVPYLGLIGAPMGSLSVKGLTMLGTWLMNYYSSSLNTFLKKDFQSLEEATLEARNIVLMDREGNIITSEDLVKIRKNIMLYDLAFQLSTANKDDVQEILSNYYFLRKDNGEFYFQNGKQMTEKEVKAIDNAIKTLTGAFCTESDKKNVRKVLELLVENREVQTQNVDILYQICDDGIIAKRDGQVVTEEEYEKAKKQNLASIMQKKEEQLNQEIADFEIIKTPDDIVEEFSLVEVEKEEAPTWTIPDNVENPNEWLAAISNNYFDEVDK